MSNGSNAISCRESDFPDTEIVLSQRSGLSIPVVEVSDEKSLLGVGSPFTISDGAIGSKCEAIFFITSTELFQSTLGLVYCLDPALSLCIS